MNRLSENFISRLEANYEEGNKKLAQLWGLSIAINLLILLSNIFSRNWFSICLPIIGLTFCAFGLHRYQTMVNIQKEHIELERKIIEDLQKEQDAFLEPCNRMGAYDKEQ